MNDDGPITKIWLERANQSPVLYHAMLWGYSFPEYLSPKQRKVITSHYTTAIKEMVKLIDSESTATDEMLLAVTLLSVTERVPPEPPGFGFFQPLLARLQTINIVERLHFAEPHRSAVKQLVADRGGLKNVTMPGVAEALQ
jgi:nitrate reductase beta subunit